MLVWHGQTCYISQIKTKRVGAWPLWIFSMVAQIFNVSKFIFAKSSRRKIFFCWGHTNTLGTFLRRSPPQWLMSSSDYKSYLWRGYELHIGNDHWGLIGFQSSLKFLRLDLMSSKSVDAVLATVVHELLGNGGQRAGDNNRWACESQI